MGSAIDETGKLFSTPLTEIVPEGGQKESQQQTQQTQQSQEQTSTVGRGKLTPDQIAQVARQAGIPEDKIPTMVAIAMAESSGNSEAHNAKYPDDSYGLWQINMLDEPGYELGKERREKFGLSSNEELKDPLTNAKVAYEVYKAEGYDAWSVYKSGAYKTHLPAARKAAKRRSPAPTASPRVTSSSMSLIPQGMNERGGFIQGGSGTTEMHHATHFHIDSKDGKRTPENLAGIREVAFHAAKAMLARGSHVHFGNINQTIRKDPGDAKLKQIIAAEQQAHGRRSTAAVDIQELNSKVKRTFPGQPGSKTKFPFKVGEVYMRGGYGREAEILGTNGITVSHGAEGSIASPVSGTDLQASLTPTQTRQVIPVVDTRPTESQRIESSSKGSSMIASVPLPEGDVLNRLMKQKFITDLAYL